ncbi:slightly ste11-like protein [Paramarasmius palmivorus]|uniref:Slightly ste11-like protein n=1 Tax=Paramarasmius palmivorus TaxID=297713 RepID=A0AAW0BH79_9AGAR
MVALCLWCGSTRSVDENLDLPLRLTNLFMGVPFTDQENGSHLVAALCVIPKVIFVIASILLGLGILWIWLRYSFLRSKRNQSHSTSPAPPRYTQPSELLHPITQIYTVISSNTMVFISVVTLHVRENVKLWSQIWRPFILPGMLFLLFTSLSVLQLALETDMSARLNRHLMGKHEEDNRSFLVRLLEIVPLLRFCFTATMEGSLNHIIRKWISNRISQFRLAGAESAYSMRQAFRANEAPMPPEHREQYGMFSFSRHFSITGGVFSNVLGNQFNTRLALSNIYGFGVSVFQVSFDPLFRGQAVQDLRQVASKVLEILPRLVYEQVIFLAASLDQDVIYTVIFLLGYYSFKFQSTRSLEGTQRQLVE